MKSLNRSVLIVAAFFQLMVIAPNLTQAAVYVNSLSGTPAPEPYTVGPGKSLSSLYIDGISQITVTGGSIIHPGGEFSRTPLRLANSAKAVVSGGLIWMNATFGNGGDPAIEVNNDTEILITGGVIKSTDTFDNALIARNTSDVTISGGTFNANRWDTIQMFSSGVMDISGGTFQNTGTGDVLFLRSGQTRITGGNFTGGTSGRGMSITGGHATFENASVQSNGEGVFLNGGRFDLHSGSITSLDEGLRMLSGVVNITGGMVQGGLRDITIDGGTLNLFVRSALLNGQHVNFGALPAAAGVLSVRFGNRQQQDLLFTRSNGQINLIAVEVPEPSGLALLAGPLLFAIRSRRSRGCPKC